ncbi:MAG: TIGR02757 family protein [Bacteroidia bacterium]|jgi:uncharacterized protein (TIGR02757 family)
MRLTHAECAEILEEKANAYNRISFIENDPICIPHRFESKADREISGFLAATIAWGQRKTLIANAEKLIEWMDGRPADFIINHTAKERKRFLPFVHRTFNGADAIFFIERLQHIYSVHGSLERLFETSSGNAFEAIVKFRTAFLGANPPERHLKHVANPEAGSAAKRLNMFLRWMVRKDQRGVDFGIWSCLAPSDLRIPLDVHSGTTARSLGLLTRNANDWQAVEELTASLRQFDPIDPVRYDFALFGMGVNEKISRSKS